MTRVEERQARGQTAEADRPLAGMVVVDCSRYLPGPLVGRLLADLGARVVKVEEPTAGDPARHAPPLVGEISALGALLLAGVESVALDLKTLPGRTVLRALVDRADVLLESFRPGTLGRLLGEEPEELRLRLPGLVVCSLSGWGQEGPLAARSGHDLTYQAVAGTLAPTGATPAVPLADHLGAWSAASSVLAALVARGRTGQGAWIDVALFDAALHANLTSWAEEVDRTHSVGERLGLSGALPCYRVYRTGDDGWLAVAALEPRFWRRFLRAAGRTELRSLQYRRDLAAHERVEMAVRERTTSEWRALLERVDLPVEVVLSAAEARAHPQAQAREVLTTGPDGLPRLGFPARFDGRRPRATGAVPRLGEATDAVLAELGLPGAHGRGRRGVGPRRSVWQWIRRLVIARVTGGG